jgi:CheY-like chemotaxis protein
VTMVSTLATAPELLCFLGQALHPVFIASREREILWANELAFEVQLVRRVAGEGSAGGEVLQAVDMPSLELIERASRLRAAADHIEALDGGGEIIRRALPITQAGGEVLFVVVTYERREGRLRSSPESTVGRDVARQEGLLDGIAHDFNNILTSIRGNASMALEDLGEDHPTRELIVEIERAAEGASELVGQLRERPALKARAERGEGGTVLVVEDESSVRRLTAKILGRMGYHVLVVDSGDRALELAAEREGTIDLLLTDVFMPGTKGSELARKMMAMDPAMKVIFMSGYDEEQLRDCGIDISKQRLLKKPFQAAELIEAAGEALGAQR